MSIPPDVAQRLLHAGYVPEPTALPPTAAPAEGARVSVPPPVRDSAAAGAAPPLPPPPKMSIEDLTLALTALGAKIAETRQQTSITEIKGNMAKQTAENKERLAMIEESAKKADEAKKSGVWGKVFGWVATIAATIAAVALSITGVGALVGAALIAAAVIGLAMQVVNEIPAAKEWMANHSAVGWVMMGVQVALSVCTLGAGLAGALKTATDVAWKSAVAMIGKVANLLGSTATVGGGASGVATAILNSEASGAQVDAKAIEAELLKLQGLLDEEMARLKKMMEEAEESVSMCMSIMSGASQAKQNVIAKMAV
ncbi:MAG: hypothetical protein C1943_11815 [Halochromatium sp.]|nr:hypothetical protein [Halochromatium sp.]